MKRTLPIVERFHSIQAEGAHAGRSAFFIRIAGCKVGCQWCDTKESWSKNNHPQISLNKLAKETIHAISNGAAFLVLTGGEPLHHNLNPLFDAIKEELNIAKMKSFPIHLETSGVNEISGQPNWITLSPKPHAPPRIELLSTCQEIKVIVESPQDILFAKEMAGIANQGRQDINSLDGCMVEKDQSPLLYLQPAWGNQQGLSLALDHVKKHPEWRLSLQIHKWLGVL